MPQEVVVPTQSLSLSDAVLLPQGKQVQSHGASTGDAGKAPSSSKESVDTKDAGASTSSVIIVESSRQGSAGTPAAPMAPFTSRSRSRPFLGAGVSQHASTPLQHVKSDDGDIRSFFSSNSRVQNNRSSSRARGISSTPARKRTPRRRRTLLIDTQQQQLVAHNSNGKRATPASAVLSGNSRRAKKPRMLDSERPPLAPSKGQTTLLSHLTQSGTSGGGNNNNLVGNNLVGNNLVGGSSHSAGSVATVLQETAQASASTRSDCDETLLVRVALLERELHEERQARDRDRSVMQQATQKQKRTEQELRHALLRKRECLRDTLRNLAIREHESLRRILVEESVRLGRIQPQRAGNKVLDYWIDGEAFHKLRRRRRELDEEYKEMERHREEWRKRRMAEAARKRRKSDTSAETDAVELELQLEKKVLDMRTKLLDNERRQWEDERNRLDSEKLAHQKFIRLMEDQKSSRYHNLPTVGAKGQRYQLLSLLGKGGFSEVWKAYDLALDRYVAIKFHALNSTWSKSRKENYIKHATREYEIHKTLDHEHIIRLIDVFGIDLDSFCTVLEFCEGTDLDSYLKKHRTLPLDQVRNIAAQLFSALRHLSEQKMKVIHYDLKPANILFRKGSIKLTDFGLSKVMPAKENASLYTGDTAMELTSQGAGTYWYLPPECFEQNPRITTKVDVWSAGVILYQLLYGVKPFGHGMTQEQIMQQNVISRFSEVQFPDERDPANCLARQKVPADVKTFLRSCLSPDARRRPDPLTCMESEAFFRDYLNKSSRRAPRPPQSQSMQPPQVPVPRHLHVQHAPPS